MRVLAFLFVLAAVAACASAARTHRLRSRLQQQLAHDLSNERNERDRSLWTNLPPAIQVATDGQMAFLRDWFQVGAAHAQSVAPKLMAAEAGIDAVNGHIPNTHVRIDGTVELGANAVGPFILNPGPLQKVNRAQLQTWLALTALQRTFVTTHAAAFAPLVAPGLPLLALEPFVPVLGGPPDPFAGCDPNLASALITAGAAIAPHGTNRAKALAALNVGGAASCDLPLTAADASRFAAAVIAVPHEWSALTDHYVAFRNVIGQNPNNIEYDYWALVGNGRPGGGIAWLYATDRDNGHRVVGASGWVAITAPTAYSGWATNMVRKAAAAPQPPQNTLYGLQADTVGHVRPNMFGGMPDTINFLPQSDVGQEIVRGGEVVAQAIKTACPGTNVRYTVSFTYAAAAGRRPTTTQNVVETDANCNHPSVGNVGAGVVYDYQGITF